MSLPVHAAGKGIICKLIFRLSGFWAFTFFGKSFVKTSERGWEIGKSDCNRHFYIVMELSR